MALTRPKPAPGQRLRHALPDLIGCAFALVMAWTLGWRTGDLIWSMWLASLVIGYSLIIWRLFGPQSGLALGRDGRRIDDGDDTPSQAAPGNVAVGLGKLVLLAFFTVHFGGFHWGHSMFVNGLYPITSDGGGTGSPDLAEYWVVIETYGWFLPLAFLAQRGLFRSPKNRDAAVRQNATTDNKTTDAGSTQRGRSRRKPGGSDMGAAYLGVVKLHLLIFFLIGADALGLPEFLTFGVVYLVYFFPWSDVFGSRASAPARTH